MKSFKIISTFSGCGGSSLGYKLAGGKILLAVEWDKNAVETYRLNFPDTDIYHGDISKLSVDEIITRTGIKVGELDIFDGSPPCQGFSTAGKRILNDPRNQLFKEYIRILAGLKPKVFVMENVSGMVKGKMRLIFVEILKELKSCGYNVKAKVLNAKYFNVPQSRERIIFIGVRNDLKLEPKHPKPKSKPIPIKNVIPSIKALRSQQINPWIDSDKTAPTLCKTHVGYKGLPAFNDSYAKLWPRVPIGGSAADVIGKGFNSCRKLDPKKVSNTLPKLQTGRGFATLCHPYEPRALTIDEAKIIGSFPENFKFIGSYSEQWARIGNSVPPNFMKAIAEAIKTEILDKSENIN